MATMGYVRNLVIVASTNNLQCSMTQKNANKRIAQIRISRNSYKTTKILMLKGSINQRKENIKVFSNNAINRWQSG